MDSNISCSATIEMITKTWLIHYISCRSPVISHNMASSFLCLFSQPRPVCCGLDQCAAVSTSVLQPRPACYKPQSVCCGLLMTTIRSCCCETLRVSLGCLSWGNCQNDHAA